MKISDLHFIPQPKKIKLTSPARWFELSADGSEFHDLDPRSENSPIRIEGDVKLPEDGYRLRITPKGIRISAATGRGAQYACLTLGQILAQCEDHARGIYKLPCLEITDSPDFAVRGFMLDVSRGRVPRLETLLRLVDLLAVLKYNHLELYIEHTYAFKKHPLLGKGHSPLKPADIKKLDAYCRDNGIDLVPNLQSFGHAAHILKHKKYSHLAESPFRGGWTLTPVEKGTYKLLDELYDDYLPSFSHREVFNVGCDETWDLGRGKSKKLADKIGLGRVYLGHLLKVHKLVKKRGMRMAFWGDILEHYPDLVSEIPQEVIMLLWEYEAGGEEKRYRKRLEPARKAGLERWVCPGTSTWNSFFFRKENAKVNIREFAKAGLDSGAKGFLLTTWGDNGHYNFLSQSFWAIAYGADAAWRAKPDAAAENKFDERFCSLVLDDDAGKFVGPLRLLGELVKDFGVEIKNTSPERMFFTGMFKITPLRLGVVREIGAFNKIKAAGFRKALKNAERAAALLERIKVSDEDISMVRDEWMMGARLAAHACKRALWMNHGEGNPKNLKKEIEGLAREFENIWLASDQESDLRDIRAEFKAIAKGYTRKPEKIVLEFRSS